MGMLCITCKGKVSRFMYKCDKKDVMTQIIMHIKRNGREKTKVNGKTTEVILLPEDFTASWQNGTSWDNDAPTENVPIPPMKSGR